MTRGVHDDRWIKALRAIGIDVVDISRVDFPSDTGFEDHVASEASRVDFVIAGPLELARRVAKQADAVVLLSWGFYIQDADTEQLDLERFTAVIVDSTANREIAEVHGARKILLIPWVVDIDAMNGGASAADLSPFGIAHSERVVLSLRAHEELYRVADIIEAFAMVDTDARLVVGNSGSLTSQLQDQARSLGIDATFIPAVAEDEVPALLRRSSVYVTASRVDGTSVTLLQAMACGVPVVASANSGNADWVEDGVTGFMFPVGDAAALAYAIQQALDNGDSVKQSALAQVRERADWNRNVHQLQEFLTNL
jgi:glycosyltransferase involved in cell wall biosynthesis